VVSLGLGGVQGPINGMDNCENAFEKTKEKNKAAIGK
jgi:hypothetical protein